MFKRHYARFDGVRTKELEHGFLIIEISIKYNYMTKTTAKLF